jgi:uncharacterized protein
MKETAGMSLFRRLRAGAILLVMAGLAIAGVIEAGAQSFDCARARQPDEHAVCADRLLSDLDEIMADFYLRLRAFTARHDNAMGLQGQLVAEARAFLGKRRACGADRACLERVYRQRILALLDRWRESMSHMAAGGPLRAQEQKRRKRTAAEASSAGRGGPETAAGPDDASAGGREDPAAMSGRPAEGATGAQPCRAADLLRDEALARLCPDLSHMPDMVETWVLDDAHLACALPCRAAAYNVRVRVYLVNRGGSRAAAPVSFPSVRADGTMTEMEEIVSPVYDPKTRTVSAFERGRGLGDCGEKWRWRWTGQRFGLVRQQVKEACDGNPGPWQTIYP